ILRQAGEVYTTRFDAYSEYDLSYQSTSGLRLSAAGWYDPSFPSHPRVGPAGAANSSFGPQGNWPSNIKRYYGSGAEMLDSFVYTRVDLGDVPVSFKAGRFAQVWGESVFGGVGGSNSIGYAQSPNDGRKSSQNPNASLKETAVPTAQLSLVFNVADNANLSMYRSFEWRPDRVPGSGTYMGFGDGVGGAPYLFCNQAAGLCYPYGSSLRGRVGDWGVQYKVRPSWVDASVSVNYRQFSEKAPWYAVWDMADGMPGLGQARSVYGRDTKMAGVTFNTTKWDVSWAGELNFRKNAALVSDFSALAPAALGGGNTSVTPTQGARGNTLHALLNAQVVLGKTPLWDTLTIAAEGAVTHLMKVTENAELFQAAGSGYAPVVCNMGAEASPTVAGCANRTAESLGLYFDPTIYSVLPSVDLEIPIFIQANFHNSPLNSGSTAGFNTLSAGLKATWNTESGPQVFQLTYLGFTNRTSAGNTQGHAILGAPYYDRSQIQFSYTASF
ncbi:DUF1302 domain-containing protein, partial [Ideonella sp. B508-1]|uniref:DUF1302 domain-containing protein n=1 Tax=Ideonella sp. B508-1 TaxID=137716 RepID=UPI0003B43D4A